MTQQTESDALIVRGNKIACELDDFNSSMDRKARMVIRDLLDAMDAQAQRIVELGQDRDEWREATLMANENSRREDLKRREMQEERDTHARRIVELDEVVAELEGCHTDQILRAIAAEEERDTLRAELDALKKQHIERPLLDKVLVRAGKLKWEEQEITKLRAELDALRGQEPVGVIQHLNELNDEWTKTLPIGTKLYAAPVAPAQPTTCTLCGAKDGEECNLKNTSKIACRMQPAQPAQDVNAEIERNDIIRIAQEAGICPEDGQSGFWVAQTEDLARFITLAKAAQQKGQS